MSENDKKIFLGLYQMLLADAEIHPRELEVLYKIGKEKGGISDIEIQQAIFTPNNILLDNLKDVERIEYLYSLSRIAWADGKLDDKEKELLQATSKILGFDKDNVEQIVEFLLEQASIETPFDQVLKIIKTS